MKEIVTIKGYWFLPSNPENRIGGTLHYLPNERIYLELIGSFGTPHDFLESMADPGLKPEQIIYGEGQNAEQITLLHCHRYGSLNFNSSFAMTNYSVDFVINGIHLANFHKKAFHSIKVHLPLLTEWVNWYPMKYSIPFKNDRVAGFELGYHIDDHYAITTNLTKGINLEINYECSGPSETFDENIKLRQGYSLELKSKRLVSLAKYLELIYRFKSFLSLASQTEVDFNNINLYCNQFFSPLKKRKILRPIKLYFIQGPVTPTLKKASRKFLFQHKNIETDFPAIINRWFGFDHQMLPIINHLIESIRQRKVFKSGDFLVVVQALEGFHTRFRTIINPKPKKRIGLQDRLKDLKKEFAYVPKIKNLKINMAAVADTRHYYSHFFPKGIGSKVADGKTLYEMTAQLKQLLICCILAETGLSKEAIINSLK